MNNCTQCGVAIPEDQRICSMCYGDIGHGNDGLYQKWLEEQEQRRRANPEPSGESE